MPLFHLHSSAGTYFKKRYLLIITIIIVTLISIKINYTIVQTSANWDLGWLRQAIWHNPLLKTENTNFSTSYVSWTWHFYPFLSFVSLISFLWPFGSLSWLIIFLSLPVVVICATVSLILKLNSDFSNSSVTPYFVALLFTSCLGFLQNLLFPHYEIWYVSLFVLSMYFAIRKQNILALVFFVLCSLVREDVIFYVAPLLICFHNSFKARSLVFLVGVLAVPSSIFLVVRGVSSTGQSLFQEEYLGSPIFSHLSIEFCVNRLGEILQNNAALLLCFFGLSILAFKVRDRTGMLLSVQGTCYIFLLSLSKSELKGTLGLYYNFPVWLILFLMTFQLTQFTNLSFSSIRTFFIWIMLSSLLALPTNNFGIFVKTLSFTAIPSPSESSYAIAYAQEQQMKIDNHFFVYSPESVVPTDFIGEQVIEYGCLLTLKTTDVTEYFLPPQNSITPNMKMKAISKNFKTTCSSRK